MSQSKKPLLRVTNLKQYFPLKKKGMYVKANDGSHWISTKAKYSVW